MKTTQQYKDAPAFSKSGQGAPLVLLHGFPFNKKIWDQVLPVLETNHTVYTVDLPGFGDSAHLEPITNMAAAAEGLYRWAEAIGLYKFVLCGHSMGGYIALAFAKKYNSHLSGLVLLHSVATADSAEKKEGRNKTIALIEKGGVSAYIRESVSKTFSADFREKNNGIVSNWIEEGKMVAPHGLTQTLQSLRDRTESLSYLNSTKLPVLWIAGAHDELMPVEDIKQQAVKTNSEVFVLKESGHMSMLEEPVNLANKLKEFVTFCNRRE